MPGWTRREGEKSRFCSAVPVRRFLGEEDDEAEGGAIQYSIPSPSFRRAARRDDDDDDDARALVAA